MGTIIDKMTNNSYKILKYMYTRQIEDKNGEKYVPLSQVEIADILEISTITANKLFKELKDNDLLYSIEGKRGKYKLSDKALIILQDMEELANKLKEETDYLCDKWKERILKDRYYNENLSYIYPFRLDKKN